ncbi:MAG TPA: hypothetical protein DEP87_04055 [Candidatus Pacebacteria bacterium]|nr:hypothetical protein [Candidatus Paceibacterota bacterium]
MQVFSPLAQLTADFLQSQAGQDFLPELTSLQTVVENNLGHDHQSVFDHTVAVMRALEVNLPGEFLSATNQLKFQNYFQQKITQHSRADLMRLAVLVHDLTKGETLVTQSDGVTSCPAHEILAAARVVEFQDRFELDQTEVEWTQQVVRLHGGPHGLLELGLAKPNQQAEILHQFVIGVDHQAIELLLMVLADLQGADFAKIAPTEFSAKTNLCQNWLQQLVDKQCKFL